MEAISVWLLSAFRKRLEALELRLNRNPKHRGERKRLSEMFERFSQTFSAEQRMLFLEWEEQMNFQICKEKEELYLLGVSDGFQLYMSLDEFSHVAPAGYVFLQWHPAHGEDRGSINPVHKCPQ